jgi:hypothetical protein
LKMLVPCQNPVSHLVLPLEQLQPLADIPQRVSFLAPGPVDLCAQILKLRLELPSAQAIRAESPRPPYCSHPTN